MSKQRWNDPANVGQPDYAKVGKKMVLLIILLVFATLVKMGLNNNWFGLVY